MAEILRTEEFLPGVGRIFPQGKRNDGLARLAGALRRRGASQSEIEVELLAVNLRRCCPPLAVSEVSKIAASVARYEPGGLDQLEVAWSQVNGKHRSKYARFVALAGELQLARGAFSVALPVVRIGKLLGCSHVAASQFRKKAELMGLMKLIERYSKAMKRAATYRVDLDRVCEFLDSSLVKGHHFSSETNRSSETFTKPLKSGNSESTPEVPLDPSLVKVSQGALGPVLRLARRGFRMFPCRPRGKDPWLKDWPGLATTDEWQLSEWHSKFPSCNWAVLCGSASGCWILDIDGEEGASSSAKLRSQHGPVATLATRTKRGWHMYFRWPTDCVIHNSVGKLAPGLDVRGERGYALVPPSIHPDGNAYAWLSDGEKTIADAPPWLIALVTGAQVGTRTAKHPDTDFNFGWNVARVAPGVN